MKEDKKKKESLERLMNQLNQYKLEGNTRMVKLIGLCIEKIKKDAKKD